MGMEARDKITSLLSLVKEEDRNILDVGCGTGELARRLQSMGKSVTGIEINPERARIARSFCDMLVLGDIASPETLAALEPRSPYDLVICSEILEHFVHPDKILLALTRLTRPGGAFLVVLPNVAFYKTRLTLLRGKWDYTEEGILDRTHLRFFTKTSAEALLQEAGFRITANLATHYSSRFSALYDRLVKWRPALFGEQFIIRAVLK